MDNTPLLVLLAGGAVAFYLVQKKQEPPPRAPIIVERERKLSKSEALGGAVGTVYGAGRDLLEALSIG